MTAMKPWYLSRTVWASAVTFAVSAAGIFGLPMDQVDGPALTDTLLQAITAISGLVALFGRIGATSRIGSGK